MIKKLLVLASIIVGALLIFLLAMSFYIESRVQQTCEIALKCYAGDKIAALFAMIEGEDGCSKGKSRALWALGQLGDERALPFLRERYGGLEEANVCIHEAQFAIRKIEEERFNLPGFLWRGILSD